MPKPFATGRELAGYRTMKAQTIGCLLMAQGLQAQPDQTVSASWIKFCRDARANAIVHLTLTRRSLA